MSTSDEPPAATVVGGPPSGGLGMSAGRLEAFSDGVLAIVITLLIPDVKVPAGARGHLGTALADQWPRYAAYLSSFLIVGLIWGNHHATIQLLTRTDHGTHVLNLLFLLPLPVSVLPWPTALLAEYAREGTRGDQRLAVLISGGTSTLMAVGFNIRWRYLLRHPELHRPEVTAGLLEVRTKRSNLGLAVYPVTAVVGLVSVPLFLAQMLALALLSLLPTPDVHFSLTHRTPLITLPAPARAAAAPSRCPPEVRTAVLRAQTRYDSSASDSSTRTGPGIPEVPGPLRRLRAGPARRGLPVRQ